MKRLLPLLLILLLLLAACGEQPDTTAENDRAASAEDGTNAGEAPDAAIDEPPLPPEQDAGSPEPAAPDREGPDEDELPIITDLSPVEKDAPPQPALSRTDVTLDGISSYLRVTLPQGWTWAQAGGTAEGTVYGLYPEDDPDFKVELHYWPQRFAMCGTGVTMQEYTLPGGEKATLAYELIDDSISWTLILPEAPDSFTIQFCTACSLYEAHRAELELMLGTIRHGVLAQLDVVTPETSAG